MQQVVVQAVVTLNVLMPSSFVCMVPCRLGDLITWVQQLISEQVNIFCSSKPQK